ncbi:hypothetical protein N657DRAFT_581433 [Parathielavia appendiculata]|uniref:GDS1 winged helix domain-containing protein n=1 Tax=Parathielavia appendiculata TaxID=2587402 RepID=A0AAN6Z0I9_9PEZI|nr:hypothetical protein N657DRAFT_581433 [Parathielavia appendiculata]
MRPYNTRHKALSLSSLGIHVPGSNAARNPANRASSNASPVSMASPASPSKNTQLPTKRLKRAYSESSDDTPIERLPKKRDDAARLEHTPPPSPPAKRLSMDMSEDDEPITKTIDMEGINDEIVEAVIVQLQNTRNRPHLVKELATVLMQQLKIVQQSANPCAIISSRLATYLKRPGWSAIAPCPLAKELESVHPRRTYFYLTTCPHQPLPDPAQALALSHLVQSRAIISPSPSSAPSTAEDSDESDTERRRERSPSPEVDLSSPELDDMDDDFAMPSTPIGSFSLRGGFYMPPRPLHSGSARHHHGRAASPPLEKDEKEFTQTADGLQKRKLTGDLALASSSNDVDQTVMSIDLDRDESSLFGAVTMNTSSLSFVSSPAIRPSTTMSLNFGRKDGEVDSWVKLEGMLEWDRSPENIELDELDGLLDDY